MAMISRAAALGVLALATHALPASAQAVRGRLVDDGTLAPVSGATITLLQGEARLGAVLTDERGAFLVPLPSPGSYRLEARRLGYATTVSQTFGVEPGDTLTAEFRVLPEAVLLRPLLVTARSSSGRSRFERNRDEWGRGIFLDPGMVDSIAPRHWADVLRKQDGVWLSWGWGALPSGSRGLVPRVRTFMGSGCVTYMVDGSPVTPEGGFRHANDYLLDMLLPRDIRAVEIYRSVGEVPPGLRRFATDPSGERQCGLVVYRTREAW